MTNKTAHGGAFVIHKHEASHLHYDFRLEMEGVLKSWAVPKGPSLDPSDKRLAVQVDDHPYDYKDFEGVIPEGEYGAGPVMIWDQGRWIPEGVPPGDPMEGYARGSLKFLLEGKKLHGRWALVRMKGRASDKGKENWLLIKEHDEEARAGKGDALLKDMPKSAATGRSMKEIAAAGMREAAGRKLKKKTA